MFDPQMGAFFGCSYFSGLGRRVFLGRLIEFWRKKQFILYSYRVSALMRCVRASSSDIHQIFHECEQGSEGPQNTHGAQPIDSLTAPRLWR